MSLIDAFLTRAIRRGQLTVTLPSGTKSTYGTPDPAYRSVAVTLHDRRTLFAIARDPSLGPGEAFMDGRLTIERGDIFDLIDLATANDRFEEGRIALHAGPLTRLAGRVRERLSIANAARRAKRAIAHHYDLSDRLYDLLLDADKQYSCAYYTDPPTTSTARRPTS